jgi:hypothetical protein
MKSLTRLVWMSGRRCRTLVLGVSATVAGCAGATTANTSNAEGGGGGAGGYAQRGMPAGGSASRTITGGGVSVLPLTTGGTSSTGTGGAPDSIQGFEIQTGAFVVSGTWHGYAWPVAVTSAAPGAGTSTISPADFSAVEPGATELCAQGSIGAASDYGGVAIIGMNVNQAQFAAEGNPPVEAVAISGTGITVQYTNPGRTPIRMQIQTPAGTTDPTGRWCATLSGLGGTETVTWEQFWGGVADGTQGCWNSGGIHPPVGTEISQVELLVPGGNAVPVPFSFCLQGLAQAGGTASGGATGAGGAGGMTAQTCAKSALPQGKVDFLNFLAFDNSTGAWGASTGADAGLTGGTSKYSSSGSTITYDGTQGNLHITADITANGYVGLTFWFVPCVDLSPYTGVTLSIGGTGSGVVTKLMVQTNPDYPIEVANARGACAYVTSKWSECVSPTTTLAMPASPEVMQVPFAAFAGGKPAAGVDADQVLGYQVQFECPGATACSLDVTLDEVGVYPDLRGAGL